MDLPLILQLASTLFMTGLIWMVQRVHYPLMAQVGADAFADYERHHLRRIGPIVGPVMLVEMVTAIWLLIQPSEALPRYTAPLGLGLLIGIWISTAALQVPLHRKLQRGLDPAAVRRLVATNWLRTVLWSARGVLLLATIRST